MSSYSDILEKVLTLSTARERKPSLKTIEELCKLYNHPQKTFPTIHVAGTNGKGSVCTKIAEALQHEGYVTGLYTSPHIDTFRERIQVGGVMISEKDVMELFDEVQKKITSLNISATFFEIGTLLAFLYFEKRGVDVAVIETGLGGRWDATNVITPILSVITSIGLDHIDVLGSSIEGIAYEKGGIIKRGVPVVIGPTVPQLIIKKIADDLGSPLFRSAERGNDYDQENQATARLCLSLIKSTFSLTSKSIEDGLQIKPPCRFEQIFCQKEVIFDVAHNGQGFKELLQMLLSTYPDHNYRFVVGFSKGKDISECADILMQASCAIHIVIGSHSRLASVDEIRRYFPGDAQCFLEKGIAEGVNHAISAYHQKKEVVIIAGSFFIMSEAKQTLLRISRKQDCQVGSSGDFSPDY